MQNRYNDLKVVLYERIKEKGPCDDLTLLTWLVSRFSLPALQQYSASGVADH
jgi:hypothetical protein